MPYSFPYPRFRFRAAIFAIVSLFLFGHKKTHPFRCAIWWTVLDLNQRPLRCQRSALPTELTLQTVSVAISIPSFYKNGKRILQRYFPLSRRAIFILPSLPQNEGPLFQSKSYLRPSICVRFLRKRHFPPLLRR